MPSLPRREGPIRQTIRLRPSPCHQRCCARSAGDARLGTAQHRLVRAPRQQRPLARRSLTPTRLGESAPLAPPREPYRLARRIDIDATTMVPSTASGMRTAARRSSPWRRQSSCVWRKDTTAAIPARSPTPAVVVRWIRRTARVAGSTSPHPSRAGRTSVVDAEKGMYLSSVSPSDTHSGTSPLQGV